MKKVYFVRHGESEGNAESIYQNFSTPLTEKGRSQCLVIADRCEKFPLDVIISSTMTRTQETAKIISRKIKKGIEYSDLFVECRRPKEQIGKSRKSPETLKTGKAIQENFHIPGFRFSDEENFEDLKKRAQKALRYLEKKSEENILVVTHGFFMRVLAAFIIFGKDLTSYECEKFMRKIHMKNTGITVFHLEEKDKKPIWSLWIWNDHAHLS